MRINKTNMPQAFVAFDKTNVRRDWCSMEEGLII